MSNVVPLDKLQMPQLPVWMVTLFTPNFGLLKQFPNPEQLIETLNNLEVSVAWTVLVLKEARFKCAIGTKSSKCA